MKYNELVKLMYQEKQPMEEIERLVTLTKCKNKLPPVDGDYLIFHEKYCYCIWGYTVKDKWGADNEVFLPNGTVHEKVTHWAELNFLEA